MCMCLRLKVYFLVYVIKYIIGNITCVCIHVHMCLCVCMCVSTLFSKVHLADGGKQGNNLKCDYPFTRKNSILNKKKNLMRKHINPSINSAY